MNLNLDEWRDLASPIFEVYRGEEFADEPVDIQIGDAGGLFISKVVMPRERVIHDPRINNDVRNDYLLFERFFSGTGRNEVDGVEYDIMPSRLYLADMSKRFVSEKTRTQSSGICIPHEVLGFQPGDDLSIASIELNSPQGRLLASAHAELWAAKDNGSVKDEAILAEVFVDLVKRLMLGKHPGRRRNTETELPLAFLLRDYIAVNLHHPDLGVEKLASVFNISRPTVYRHFEKDRGVARYIRNARLDRCFFELSVPSRERGRVASVSSRWHFNDAANFSRLFRERFGVSPSARSNGYSTPIKKGLSDLSRIAQDWFEPNRL